MSQGHRSSRISQLDIKREVLNIYDGLQSQNSDIIRKLQEEEENILMAFLHFNLRLMGLEKGIRYLDGIQAQLRSLIEQADQIQEDRNIQFVDQEICQSMMNPKSPLYQQVTRFYETLFMTSWIFDQKLMPQILHQLTMIGESRIGIVRATLLEYFGLLIPLVIGQVKENQVASNVEQCKMFLKQLGGYLVDQKIEDDQPQLQKRACDLVFSMIDYYPQTVARLLDQDQDDNIILHTFARLNRLLDNAIETETRPSSLKECISCRLTVLVGLVGTDRFNIKVTKFIQNYVEHFQEQLTIPAINLLCKQLLNEDQIIRFEIASMLHVLNYQFKDYLQVDPKKEYLKKLIGVFLEITNGEYTYQDVYRFITSFIPHHKYLLNVNTYIDELLTTQDSLSLPLMFFSAQLEYIQILMDNPLQWVKLNADELFDIFEHFSMAFCEKSMLISKRIKDFDSMESLMRIFTVVSFNHLLQTNSQQIMSLLIGEFQKARNYKSQEFIATVFYKFKRSGRFLLEIQNLCEHIKENFKDNIQSCQALIKCSLISYFEVESKISQTNDPKLVDLLATSVETTISELILHYTDIDGHRFYYKRAKHACRDMYRLGTQSPTQETLLKVLRSLILSTHNKMVSLKIDYRLPDDIKIIIKEQIIRVLDDIMHLKVDKLSVLQVNIIKELLNFLKLSPYFYDLRLGIPIYIKLFQLSLHNEQLRIIQLEEKLETLLRSAVGPTFWVLIKKMVSISSNDLLPELASTTLDVYVNAINKNNVVELRTELIQFIGESLSDVLNISSIVFLHALIQTPSRLVIPLQISSQTLKELHALFEVSTKELYEMIDISREHLAMYSKYERLMREIFNKNDGLKKASLDRMLEQRAQKLKALEQERREERRQEIAFLRSELEEEKRPFEKVLKEFDIPDN